MARYKVSHGRDRTWIGRLPDGSWGWVKYEDAKKFDNFYRAREAFESLPLERGMYNFPIKPNYMKVEYTEAEKNLPGNEWMKLL